MSIEELLKQHQEMVERHARMKQEAAELDAKLRAVTEALQMSAVNVHGMMMGALLHPDPKVANALLEGLKSEPALMRAKKMIEELRLEFDEGG